MNANYITFDDVKEAKEKGRMVQIKCKFCSGDIGNHIGIIKDHIREGYKLHQCKCGAITKINSQEVDLIKKLITS